jgi:SAM-dependent methyltransferase
MHQHAAFEQIYADDTRWEFHDTSDPLTRYVRDRRLRMGLHHALAMSGASPGEWDALVVAGGVGGEGSFLANAGLRSVTVSDYSENALKHCRVRDPRLLTLQLDAEQPALDDGSYDLVVVQDSLHHLSRPVQGFVEMLRVARQAVIVLEPHLGLISRIFGTEWETLQDQVNYVFRWNRMLLEQPTRSYLLRTPYEIRAIRRWDHSGHMHRIARHVGPPACQVAFAKTVYSCLDFVLRPFGNAMIGVIVRQPPEGDERSAVTAAAQEARSIPGDGSRQSRLVGKTRMGR